MRTIDRRGFLQRVAGVSAGAAGLLYPGAERALGFGSTARGAVREGTLLLEPHGPDPTYAGGDVVAQTDNGIVLQAAGTSRGVRIPATTVVWKETEVGPDVIATGDWLDVKGSPQDDGTLLATSGMVFVNIGRRDGTVVSSDPDSATLLYGSDTFTIELSDYLEVISAADGTPYSDGPQALYEGCQMGAVGLNLPNGGFRATRIWF